MPSLPNLESTTTAQKLRAFTSDLALRISVHEAGHVLFALENGRDALVQLPALESSRRATRFQMDAATALSADALGDEALIDIMLGGFCAERAYLRLPSFSREAHRAANDCFHLIARLDDPTVLLAGIPVPVHRRPNASLPAVVQQNVRLHYAQDRLRRGSATEANAIVLGIMGLPIARQTLNRVNERRDELIDLADRLFCSWEAREFDVTKVHIASA